MTDPIEAVRHAGARETTHADYEAYFRNERIKRICRPSFHIILFKWAITIPGLVVLGAVLGWFYGLWGIVVGVPLFFLTRLLLLQPLLGLMSIADMERVSRELEAFEAQEGNGT